MSSDARPERTPAGAPLTTLNETTAETSRKQEPTRAGHLVRPERIRPVLAVRHGAPYLGRRSPAARWCLLVCLPVVFVTQQPVVAPKLLRVDSEQ